jgi:small nuclear ribonucleoprotein E
MIYKYFQTKSRVEIWLFDNTELRIEGRIIGFDEYMNCVLEDADEIYLKKNAPESAATRRKLGKIMLKGDNISLICNVGE